MNLSPSRLKPHSHHGPCPARTRRTPPLSQVANEPTVSVSQRTDHCCPPRGRRLDIRGFRGLGCSQAPSCPLRQTVSSLSEPDSEDRPLSLSRPSFRVVWTSGPSDVLKPSGPLPSHAQSLKESDGLLNDSRRGPAMQHQTTVSRGPGPESPDIMANPRGMLPAQKPAGTPNCPHRPTGDRMTRIH
jgi:hypothetical protein